MPLTPQAHRETVEHDNTVGVVHSAIADKPVDTLEVPGRGQAHFLLAPEASALGEDEIPLTFLEPQGKARKIWNRQLHRPGWAAP